MQTTNVLEGTHPEFQPSELVEYGRIEEITQAGTQTVNESSTDTQSYS